GIPEWSLFPSTVPQSGLIGCRASASLSRLKWGRVVTTVTSFPRSFRSMANSPMIWAVDTASGGKTRLRRRIFATVAEGLLRGTDASGLAPRYLSAVRNPVAQDNPRYRVRNVLRHVLGGRVPFSRPTGHEAHRSEDLPGLGP